jgi:hypothetical protein
VLDAAGSVFRRSEANTLGLGSAAGGGAIGLRTGSFFTCETTTFDSNKVLGGTRESSGGALDLLSARVELGTNTVLNANLALGAQGAPPHASEVQCLCTPMRYRADP